jgi:pterin-4a-carbinolamine dehydratase
VEAGRRDDRRFVGKFTFKDYYATMAFVNAIAWDLASRRITTRR